MSLQWFSVEQTTGLIIEELNDLTLSGKLKGTIGRYETVQASLPVATAPPDWERATEKGYAALVAVEDDLPLWGGLLSNRQRGIDGMVQLSLATAESYFDRRHVGDKTYTGVSQTAIVSDLVTSYAVADGLPFLLNVTPSTTLRDRQYLDADDKTLYSILTELMAVEGGPEFTVTWQWLHNPERLVPVLNCADRLGAPPIEGLAPNASFDLPGSITDFVLSEDYSAGKGATWVMASASGQGDDRPASDPQIDVTSQRPRYEYRFQPSTSTTDKETLNNHAQRAATLLNDGQTTLTLTANRQDAPRLGVDWGLGDDIAYDLTDPSLPLGLAGTARAISYEIDDDTISPILYVPGV